MDVAFGWAQVVLVWGVAVFFSALGLGGLAMLIAYVRDTFW